MTRRLVALLVCVFLCVGRAVTSAPPEYQANRLPMFPILIVSEDKDPDGFLGQIKNQLAAQDMEVASVADLQAALGRLKMRKTFGALVLDSNMFDTTKPFPGELGSFLDALYSVNSPLPVFLITDSIPLGSLPAEQLRQLTGFVRKNEDTPSFIAGTIRNAALKYRDDSLPPFFKALAQYVDDCNYAWSTPGHAGGIGFLASTPGSAFMEFFGENLFRADLSSSMPQLGSILEHQGPAGEAERLAARIFGADHTFFVLNGTSTANKMVWDSIVAAGDIVIVDRNCHKSIMHAIIMTGGIPVYLTPTRNPYGIIGTIPLESFTPESLARVIARSPLTAGKRKPRIVVITNSTYDGLCYYVVGIKDRVGNEVDNLHFDEAWYGYARFHPLYAGRFGMSPEGEQSRHPPTFATQSSHKLLAAFSQGSMIHIRDGGERKVDHERFNEAFLMHESTSPFYPMFASLDVAAKMMEGDSGRRIMRNILWQAIRFRQKMAALSEQTAKDDWCFRVWQPEKIGSTSFAKADPERLMTDTSCWLLKDGDAWHGFKDFGKNQVMLDPIKVTILTPGVDETGRMAGNGIPAGVVSEFLRSRSVIPEKTGHYNILFLFAPGVTEGKAAVLLSRLLEFKQLYDSNAPVKQVLPKIAAQYPERYGEMRLRDLCQAMHEYLRKNNLPDMMAQVYASIPPQQMIPADSYAALVHGQTEYLALGELPGRVPAVMIVPYPPGIPVIMPGEKFGASDCPMLRYLRMCEDFDNLFPGFETEIHGVKTATRDDRLIYQVDCVKPEVAKSP